MNERRKRGATQRITASDIASGRLRIPSSGTTKLLLPDEVGDVRIVLKGRPLGTCRYDPRVGPDRERSGVISIRRAVLAEVVREGEVLPVIRSQTGTVYVGDRGSKLRIAEWVNDRGVDLGHACVQTSRTLRDFVGDALPAWRSPLLADDYVEFASDLWKRLNLPAPDPSVDGFWPSRQPNWDAVAVLEGRKGLRGLLLVEAKSHTNEIVSSMSAKSPESTAMIERSLKETQAYLGVGSDLDWTRPYYQAANRLAFLYYLRARRNIPTWLFNVYFLGDAFEVNGQAQPCPVDADGWRPALSQMHEALGLPSCHPLTHFAHDLFIPVAPEV